MTQCQKKLDDAHELAKLILESLSFHYGCSLFDDPKNDVLNDMLVIPEKRIYDIFLYGSVARGEGTPNDIDIMIIDNNTYCLEERGIDYYILANILKDLLEELFFSSEEISDITKRVGKVDIHLIPKEFFTNKITQAGYKYSQSDALFFEKVFQDIMVYDPKINRFVKMEDLFGYLERRYSCSLTDLKMSPEEIKQKEKQLAELILKTLTLRPS